MKKQKSQLLILLGVLIVTALGYLGLKYMNQNQSGDIEEVSEVEVLSIPADEVIGFSYDYEGEIYSFVKEEDSWIYEGDTSLDLDESMVDDMIGSVTNISSEHEISEPDDFEQYGLKEPARTVTLQTAEQEYKLMFGDYNSMIGKYYICLDGQQTVYTTSGYRYTEFETTPEDLTVVLEEESTE